MSFHLDRNTRQPVNANVLAGVNVLADLASTIEDKSVLTFDSDRKLWNSSEAVIITDDPQEFNNDTVQFSAGVRFGTGRTLIRKIVTGKIEFSGNIPADDNIIVPFTAGDPFGTNPMQDVFVTVETNASTRIPISVTMRKANGVGNDNPVLVIYNASNSAYSDGGFIHYIMIDR